jgi:hypothetical protein
MSRPELKALKALIEDHAPARARKSVGTLSVGGGLTLHAGEGIEVLGQARRAWMTAFLRQHPALRAAWVQGEANRLCPPALEQQGVALSRILFFERLSPGEGIELALQLLRSALFGAIIFDGIALPFTGREAQMRKLQLGAEDGGALLFFLSDRSQSSFGIRVRMEAEGADAVEFTRVKGGTLT